MTRCRSCQAKAEPRNGLCPVCGIEPDKRTGELSPVEKKVRFRAHSIWVVAIFHLIGGTWAILMMPGFPAPAPIAVLAIINLALAYGLVRYSLIAYRAATVYYFLIGMVNVISIQQGIENLAGIALALTALYLVGNGTAKALFERRLPV